MVHPQRRGVELRLLLHGARVVLLLAPEALAVESRLVRKRLGRQTLRQPLRLLVELAVLLERDALQLARHRLRLRVVLVRGQARRKASSRRDAGRRDAHRADRTDRRRARHRRQRGDRRAQVLHRPARAARLVRLLLVDRLLHGGQRGDLDVALACEPPPARARKRVSERSHLRTRRARCERRLDGGRRLRRGERQLDASLGARTLQQHLVGLLQWCSTSEPRVQLRHLLVQGFLVEARRLCVCCAELRTVDAAQIGVRQVHREAAAVGEIIH